MAHTSFIMSSRSGARRAGAVPALLLLASLAQAGWVERLEFEQFLRRTGLATNVPAVSEQPVPPGVGGAGLVDGALSDRLPKGRTLNPFLASERAPWSFTIGGKAMSAAAQAKPRVVTWPGVTAVEFGLDFEGPLDRPLENLHSLDLQVALTNAAPRLISMTGGVIGRGFALSKRPIRSFKLGPDGGRSSTKELPFFLVHDDQGRRGLFVGIGWSGQWQADLTHDPATGRLNLTVGMPGLSLILKRGETVRMPRILLGFYEGDEATGANLLRRLLREKYLPTLNGAAVLPPLSFNHWFTMGNAISEEKLMRHADAAAQLGLEYFVCDAGWFVGGFPGGVGNWSVDTNKFPHGLKPFSDHVRGLGMKFGLWFEPERAADGTAWRREHPTWFHGDLLDLGQADAREAVLAMMSVIIREANVEWIRYDMNTDPLPAWNAADTADRRGLTQIRHIEGLYELWGRLRERFPGLLIEGCASGGNRIDLESIRHSHTVWKNDLTTHIDTLRYQNSGANWFLPSQLLNANLCQFGEPYAFHVLFGGPLGFGAKLGEWTPDQLAAARRHIDVYRRLRPFLQEDFYALFDQAQGLDTWDGWQFHDPAKDAGFVVVFRLDRSPYAVAEVRPRGLGAEGRYELSDPYTGKSETVDAETLQTAWRISLDKPTTSLVRLYRRKGRE